MERQPELSAAALPRVLLFPSGLRFPVGGFFAHRLIVLLVRRVFAERLVFERAVALWPKI